MSAKPRPAITAKAKSPDPRSGHSASLPASASPVGLSGREASRQRQSLGLLGLVLCLLCGCGRAPVPAPEVRGVRVAEVKHLQAGRGANAPSYIALVKAENQTDLSFKVPGVVELIGPGNGEDWQEGAAVHQGAVLARLKQGDFTNAVNAARARCDLNRSLVKRNRQLLQDGAISPQEFEVMESHQRSSEAELAQALQNLQDSELSAPSDGRILARFVNAGETVSAGLPALRFGDLRRVSVELSVTDRSVQRFKVGDRVNVTISALEDRSPFPGTVTEVGVAATSDSRLFKVVIKVDNPEGLIRAGMTAKVPAAEPMVLSPSGVIVPLSALVGMPGDDTGRALAVFVVDAAQRAQLRPVKTGDIIESSIVVSDGLTEGEKVVVFGAASLYPGARVEALAVPDDRTSK